MSKSKRRSDELSPSPDLIQSPNKHAKIEEIESKDDSMDIDQDQFFELSVEEKGFDNAILDNLARLLEGASSCSAVCFINNKFVFTNNELDKNTGNSGAEGYVMIEELANYLGLDTEKYTGLELLLQEEKDEMVAAREITRKEIFKKICLQKLAGQGYPGTIHKGQTDIIDIILGDLLENHKEWENWNPKQIIAKFNLKKNRSSNPTQTATSILATYDALSRAAHDFKKIENIFRNNESLKGTKFKIVKDEESRGLHAELRVIDHLFREENLLGKAERKERIYVGISKVCCLDCRHTIKALNRVFKEVGDKEVEDRNFDLKIISADEKVTNKYRNQGAVIIRKNEEAGMEIFDYNQGEFVEVLEEGHQEFLALLCEAGSLEYKNLSSSGIDVGRYDELASSFGCAKGMIGYGDASTRETHGVRGKHDSFEKNWQAPGFMNVKSKYPPFIIQHSRDQRLPGIRRTRSKTGEEMMRADITAEGILLKYKEIKAEYDKLHPYSEVGRPMHATPSPSSASESPSPYPRLKETNTEKLIGELGRRGKVLFSPDIKQEIADGLQRAGMIMQERNSKKEPINNKEFLNEIIKQTPDLEGLNGDLMPKDIDQMFIFFDRLKEVVDKAQEIVTKEDFQNMFNQTCQEMKQNGQCVNILPRPPLSSLKVNLVNAINSEPKQQKKYVQGIR
ncbi:MAG: hypothetical protein K0R25_1122 [Rickettsiaceae bacterium]|nr:hypothetical protein [Rickettsiaceae bacterium]